ncbi:MAG: aminoglycoside phosphotransferase family protein [Anaerolineales bacterium]|jgi:hypothetical protein
MAEPETPKPPETVRTENESPSDHGLEWPFSHSELTAGLRRHTGDPTLTILSLKESEISQRRPAVGKLRGLLVQTQGNDGQKSFSLVLKQTQGSTRTGAAGAGLREKSIYQILREHLPVHLPELIAAHPKGEWLVLAHLPPGRQPEKWTAADYLLAVEQLAVLHDRFWCLDMHLNVYPWLEKPLEADRDIHLQAARADAARLVQNTNSVLSRQTDILSATEKIIDHLDLISNGLLESPATLLHGDYWPGNIHIGTNSRVTVYDWEDAAVGPAVLDVLSFIQGSSWYFSPLPVSSDEMIAHYRSQLTKAGAYTYTNDEFERLWDYAVLWAFVGGWVGNLANTPDSILAMRLPALEEVLFSPLRQALSRQLK